VVAASRPLDDFVGLVLGGWLLLLHLNVGARLRGAMVFELRGGVEDSEREGRVAESEQWVSGKI